MNLHHKTIKVKDNINRKVLFSFFLFLTLTAQAQSPQMKSYLDKTACKKEIALGLNFGIVGGIGIDAAYRIAPNWSARASVNFANIIVNNYQYTFQVKANDLLGSTPQTLSFSLAVRFNSLSLGIDHALGHKGRFRILSGLNYYPNNYLSVAGELATIIRLNDIELNGNDIGKGSIKMGFKSPVAPYIGVGIGRLHPRKRVNVSFDLKAIYKGDYKFGIFVQEGGLILKENENNAAILDKNFNAKWNNKVWPSANLRIAYRLK